MKIRKDWRRTLRVRQWLRHLFVVGTVGTFFIMFPLQAQLRSPEIPDKATERVRMSATGEGALQTLSRFEEFALWLDKNLSSPGPGDEN